jgi:hypothetical protein
MMMKAILSALLVASAAMVMNAEAATMTFEGVVTSTGSQTPVTPYTEAGFTLTNLQGGNTDGIFGAAASGVNANGTSVFGWCTVCGTTITIELTAVGGGPFSLTSLDAAFLAKVTGTPQTITALGHLLGGGTVTQTFALSPNWTTFNLSSFTSLTSVDFSAIVGDPDPAFDNLVLSSATPLPAALPLFATGLGGLGLLGWRRKRKAQAFLPN